MIDVSVIIPTWNRADCVEKAVRSALNQTLSPREVLVCDDGSTDDSQEKIRSIADERLRWIEGPHGGRPAVPRNRGILKSKGQWLAFLDSDDEWMPDKLEKQLAYAEETGCKAICSNAYRFIPGKGMDGNLLTWSSDRITFDNLLKENQIICSSVLVHTSLFSFVRGFPEDEQLKAWEDYTLWLRIGTLSDFAFIKEPLVVYRDDVPNSIRSGKVDVWGQRMAVFLDLKRWMATQTISASYSKKLRKQELRDSASSRVSGLLEQLVKLKKAFTR